MRFQILSLALCQSMAISILSPIHISPDVCCFLGFLWSFARLHSLALIALFPWTALLLRAATFLRPLFLDGFMTRNRQHITSNTIFFKSNLRAFSCCITINLVATIAIKSLKFRIIIIIIYLFIYIYIFLFFIYLFFFYTV